MSEFAADRIIDHFGPLFAFQPADGFRKDTVRIVDGTLVPIRDHNITELSKSHRSMPGLAREASWAKVACLKNCANENN